MFGPRPSVLYVSAEEVCRRRYAWVMRLRNHYQGASYPVRDAPGLPIADALAGEIRCEPGIDSVGNGFRSTEVIDQLYLVG